MTETKKGLRITAGILLLITACISLAATCSSILSLIKADQTSALLQLWHSGATALLGVIAAILILARKFIGAGIMKCLILVISLVRIGITLAGALNGISFSGEIFAGVLTTYALQLAGSVFAVLLIIGLFLHNRKSKGFLIAGAILSLSTTLISQVQTMIQYVKMSGEAKTMAVSLGINGTIAVLTFVGWILLAVYFGAQKKAAA